MSWAKLGRISLSLILWHVLTGHGYAKPFPASPWSQEKLSNGLEVVLMPSAKVPLVTIVLVFRAGARTETLDINGLTHLWEHMFFKGNATLPDQEAFSKRVRELGIVFNGDTSSEIVRYYFTLPSSNLDAGLKFMYDAISSPLLQQDELERERKVVLDEYDRAASQAGFELNNMERMVMYKELEFQRNPLGRRALIEQATREQLLRIKKEVFVPANGALVLTGDFDSKAVLKTMERIYSPWQTPKDWVPVNSKDLPRVSATDRLHMLHDQAQNSLIQITFDGPRALKQPKDTFIADVLISLLNQRSGRFYGKMVDSGLTLAAGLGYHTQGRAGELVLYAQTQTDKLPRVEAELRRELSEWPSKDYFSEVALKDVKSSLIVQHKFELNKPSEYGKTLAFWWGTTGLGYLNSYQKGMQEVSLADVRDFWQRYFNQKPSVVSILSNRKDALAAGVKDQNEELKRKYLRNYELRN